MLEENNVRQTIIELGQNPDDNKLHTRIFAVVGHELNSPIASIRSYCDYLIENADSERVLDAALKMRRTTRHVEDFIANLSEFVRLGSGEATLNPRTFCFRALLQEIVDLFMPYAQHKGIFLSYDVQSRTDYAIYADELRIRQIVMNLVKNAITHTDNGAVDITAAISSSNLRVCVRDDGIGMSENLITIILSDSDPRLAPSCEFGGGLGLGLLICKQLLTLMHSRLSLESAPGFGTIAEFELPLGRPSA